jgi:Secretion system C-terminal sorting domain
MKKRTLLFTVIAGMGYLLFSSYQGGPAFNSRNCTGAKASVTNCGGSGCHGTGTTTSVTITVDSGSSMTPTTRYKPGMTYTIKVHGTNTSSLPKFGFEFASVSGTGASQVQAGTFGAVSGSLSNDVFSSLHFIEQNTAIAGTSAGVYDATFTWTAPSPAVGNITMYCTLNAVDGNGSENSADISGNTSVVLTQINTTSIATISNNNSFKAYPNPVVNTLNLQNDNNGAFSVKVFDLNGRLILSEQQNATSINTSEWAQGLYQVVVSQNENVQVIPVVKQ